MFRVLLTLVVLAVFSFVNVVANPLPRNRKTCYEVECVGSSGTCITLGESDGDNIRVIIPGKANIKKVPCGSSVSPGPSSHYSTAAFVHDPNDPAMGQGWRAANVYTVGGSGQVVEYDDSRLYSTYADWLAGATN